LLILSNELKAKLGFEISELNVNFEPQKFLELFQTVKELCEKGHVEEVEQMLLQALAEGVDIANGYLYLLYFNFGPREKSRQYFDQVKKMFPAEEFWSGLAKASIWDEFSQAEKCN